VYGGRPYALADHIARMERSAANLRLPLDPEAVRADALALLDAAAPGDVLLRLVVTRGGHRLALLEPLPEHPAGVRLGSVTYAPTRVLDGIKSLSYAGNMLASRLARERGFDEALLVTPHGRVLEGPTWAFFWVRDGELLTPPLEDRILASITRARLLEECEVAQCSCTLEDLRAAEEAFIASTVREVMPIAAIDDIELPAAPGPVTLDAHARFQARVERELGAAPA
jgi:branched-chain amino acid aminotransferase